MEKVKIILDADVIIHFSKGGWLNILPSIFKNYEYSIFDTVYREILNPIKKELDNQIHFLKNINLISFDPRGDMLKEYATLSSTLGKGESACMVYCKYYNDVIGSSNLRDIKEYCQKHKITYLTTIDFLFKNKRFASLAANKLVENTGSGHFSRKWEVGAYADIKSKRPWIF